MQVDAFSSVCPLFRPRRTEAVAVAAAEDEACMGAPARAAEEEARCGEARLEPVASSVVAVVVAAVAVGVATEPFCGV